MFDFFKTNNTINTVIYIIFNAKFILHYLLHQIYNLNNFFFQIFFSDKLRFFIELF